MEQARTFDCLKPEKAGPLGREPTQRTCRARSRRDKGLEQAPGSSLGLHPLSGTRQPCAAPGDTQRCLLQKCSLSLNIHRGRLHVHSVTNSKTLQNDQTIRKMATVPKGNEGLPLNHSHLLATKQTSVTPVTTCTQHCQAQPQTRAPAKPGTGTGLRTTPPTSVDSGGNATNQKASGRCSTGRRELNTLGKHR